MWHAWRRLTTITHNAIRRFCNISAINFTAGSQVQAGDLLVEQETSSGLTQLEAAEADKSLSQSNLTRVNRLYKQQLVSRSELDSARAAFKSASARTETAMATLSKKQIVAPFSGRLGLRQVNIGQNISAGTPIVSLQAADPMLLNFSLPQQNIPLLKNGYEVRVTSDAAPDKVFTGNITAINSEIDPDTRSVSAQGLSTITVRLELNYDPIKALSEISSKVNQVRGDLPPEAEVPVINVESADSAFASAYLSFRSDILEDNQITDFLVRVVQPRLSALEGVQRADVLGGRNCAMRIWLKPELLAAHNVSRTQVRRALSSNNYLAALGQTKGSLVQVSLSANTDISTVEEFKELVVSTRGESVIRLKDVADVVLGSDSYGAEVRYSGDSATFMGVWTLPNSNALDVIKRVRNEMEELKKTLPTGMQAVVAYDATEYIESSIIEVVTTLVETLIIVMIVIFLFLGSLRSVLIPIMAIPISLIGAVFLMQVFGFSINLLTLLAVVLSVGLVVDDAIVVENVERHISEGKARLEAALMGARELIGPVIAMTITLVAVYLPIVLQGGLTGTLFKEFAFTLAGAVMISGIVALTLSPMMSAKMLVNENEKSRFAKGVSNAFDRVRNRYLKMLTTTLRVRPAMYLLWFAISAFAIPLFNMSAKDLAAWRWIHGINATALYLKCNRRSAKS